MNKSVDLKNIITCVLCITVIGMSIGYAALRKTLEKNNNCIEDAWNIKFENISSSAEEKKDVINAKTVINGTSISISTSFIEPNDSVTYSFDITNKGSINAKLSSDPIVTGIDLNRQNSISYSLTYNDGSPVKEGDILNANDKKRVNFVVNYASDAQRSMPVIINVILLYIQK